jgi:hypothetical protein
MSNDGPTNTKAEMTSEKEYSASAYNSETRTSKEDAAAKVGQNGLMADDAEEMQHNLGRLVVDVEEAEIEFGEERTAMLKKTPDGKWILWPQPCVFIPCLLDTAFLMTL